MPTLNVVKIAKSFIAVPIFRPAAILTVIVGVAIALRLYFWGGYIGLDDGEYVKFAYGLANGGFRIGDYSGPAVFPLRVGVFVPVSLAFHVIGLSEWAIVIYPLLLSVIALLLCYACGMLFFNHRTGFIAAALYAVVPLDINNATVLLPDLPAALYASLGIVGLMVLMRYQVNRQGIIFVGGLCVGLAFGLSWLCKESVSYFVLTCAVFLVMSMKASRARSAALWGGVALGSLLVLLGEMATYHQIMGDWLFRFHEIERNYRQWDNGFFSEGSDFGWAKGSSRALAVMKRLFVTGPAFILSNPTLLYLPLFGFLACFHALYWRDVAFLLPGIWLATLVFMFNFSTSSLVSYSPLPLYHRYFYPILLPSIVLTSGLVGRMLWHDELPYDGKLKKERLFWGGILAMLLITTAGWKLHGHDRPGLTWTSEVRAISKIVHPTTTLYADILTIRGLEFFSGYPKNSNWIDFESMKPQEMCSGCLVLVNRQYIAWLYKNGGMWLSKKSAYGNQEFVERPPNHWKRIYESGNASLYEVAPKLKDQVEP